MSALRRPSITHVLWSLAVVITTMASAMAIDTEVTDANVIDVIDQEMLYDTAVPSYLIDVEATDGVVTLSGSVDSILAKERAVRIAESIKGVRAVIDQIEVSPPAHRSDHDLELDVRTSLFDDPATEAYEVKVNVQDGHVFLTGAVDSWHEKQLCAKVAKGVRGVVDVTNDIDLKYPTNRLDLEIKNEIEQTLRWDVLIDHAAIDVAVHDGEVVLSGVVGSAAEKRLARNDAWTSGVRSVDVSQLDVKSWARDERLRKQKYVSLSDDAILEAIHAALHQDPRVSEFEVRATVRSGIATLRGTVDNLKARRAAGQDAKNTVGVISVNNFVKVRPQAARSDQTIDAEVENTLERDPYISRHDVDVSVYNGTVYLTGDVESYYEKAQADELASRVKGVARVVNGLSVNDDLYGYDPYVDEWDIYGYDWYDYEPAYSFKSDAAIERDIQNQLWWSPFVAADAVEVEVEDGVATLTGTVESWMEKGAARDNAYDAGATYVRNELTVER